MVKIEYNNKIISKFKQKLRAGEKKLRVRTEPVGQRASHRGKTS
jgi:hypothetical protein